MKVSKFGGTSLADSQQIKKVCDIITSDSDRRLIVVSAPGKRFEDDIKVTDLLISTAKEFIAGRDFEKPLSKIISRYITIANELGISEISSVVEADFRSRLNKTFDHDRLLDSMKAAGEDNCAKIVAAYLKSKGYDANYINPGEAGMILSDDAGNAVVLEQSYEKLATLSQINGIGIFPGFFGYSLSGHVVTFPRGGSDITGAILASAVNAEVYENFTDVDYVFSANPKVVKNPKSIEEITYQEMRELSYAGFNIYQEDAFLPVFRAGVPVNIKNVNNPSCPGTKIVAKRKFSHNYPVIGIASDNGFSCLNINKYLMNRELGFGRRLLSIFEEENISFEHMPSGIDDVSIVFRGAYISNGKKERIISRINNELKPDSVNIKENLSLIVVVGNGMVKTPGTAARATVAFANANINIHMISQGSSEESMVFGVQSEYEIQAVVALYNEFFEQSK